MYGRRYPHGGSCTPGQDLGVTLSLPMRWTLTPWLFAVGGGWAAGAYWVDR